MAVAQSAILNVMIATAEKTGRALIRDFGEVEQLQVSKKGPNDFVSSSDKKAEKIIREELQKVRPDFSFIMEESGKIAGADKDNIWIVDPLDGTLNFLHGIPHWSISIALQTKGEIVAGVIHDPIKNETFIAEKGKGAFSSKKRLRVSGRKDFTEALLAISGQKLREAIITSEHTKNRNFGCASLNMAYVASGRFDGYCEAVLSPWDKAAGCLLVKEAGGYVSEITGEKDPVHGKGIIAANPNMHELLLSKIAKLKESKG